MPAAVGRRVVDRQQLDDLHARSHSPVYHAAQVAEVAHAPGVLAAKGKDGNDHAGGPPRFLPKSQQSAVTDAHLTVGQLVVQHTVVAILPHQQLVSLVVDHHIFIFQRQPYGIQIDGEQPVALADILHTQIAHGAPAAYHRMAAEQRQRLARLQLGCRDAENGRLAVEGHAAGLHLLAVGCMLRRQVGIGIEMGTQRQVAPLVAEHITLGGIEIIGARHLRPLPAQHPAVGILHLVVISDDIKPVVTALYGRRLQCPGLSVLRQHGLVGKALGAVVAAVSDDDVHRLAPLRSVVYGKSQFHLQPYLQFTLA